jgi:FKBP-type peptidyl-prolyl cis-trans isomerase 2
MLTKRINEREGILMAQAKTGDKVKVHYTGKIDKGNVFDSSVGKEPLEFTIGNKQLISGFEEAVVDMKPGEKKTVTIASAEAYGPHREDLVVSVERKEIPQNINPEIGQVLQFQKKPEVEGGASEVIAFTVVGITDTHLTLDANHPLSGKDLTFEIELLEILDS